MSSRCPVVALAELDMTHLPWASIRYSAGQYSLSYAFQVL